MGPVAQNRAPLERVPRVVARVTPAVVAVLVDRPEGSSEGSGVIWKSHGVIITNAHVVAGGTSVEIAFATGERTRGRVVARDVVSDIALIDVARAQLPTAEFEADVPRVGELAVAVGNPLGFEHTATAGIVSGIDRAIPTGGTTPALVNLLQTDAPISPGNSGGALANADGEVIGLNVAYIPPQANAVSIGFAIPSATVIDVATQLLRTGRVRHAFLGARLQPLTAAIAVEFGLRQATGALVTDVVPESPANAAALLPGDLITRVGVDRVESVEDVYAAVRARRPGETVSVSVLRDGARRQFRVRLANRPPSG